MKLGIDVSTYLEEKASNARYFDHDQEINPLQQAKDNGVELIRLRVWNDPTENGKPYLGGTNSVDNDIEIIKELKQYDFSYIIDFHYSDFWVDPGKQTLPKAWINLSFEELKQQVYEFTKESLLRFKQLGIKIPYVQVGNETTNGMLWPHGQLVDQGKGKERTNYENFVALVNSGIKAVREVLDDAKVIIHLERSNDVAVYEELFSKLEQHNVDYDVIGMSYYAYWHGNMNQLFTNVNNCKNKFHKPVMIMELGYGFTLEDYLLTENGKNEMKVSKETIEADLPYDISKEGQAAFIEDFLNRCLENDIEGVIYWEPFWIPGDNICWASEEGQAYIHEEGKPTRNEWSNQCLFDYEGNKLPAFDKFKIKK